MSDYNTTSGSGNNSIADELYRVHCYADTLAKLCSAGSSAAIIEPDCLAQIFKDMAHITDKAAALLYDAPITSLDELSTSDQRHFSSLAQNVSDPK